MMCASRDAYHMEIHLVSDRMHSLQKAEGKRAGIWMTSSIIRDDTDGLESML